MSKFRCLRSCLVGSGRNTETLGNACDMIWVTIGGYALQIFGENKG